MGRPTVTTQRPNVTQRTRKRLGQTFITFDAYVRDGAGRTYLRTYDNRAEALAACQHFIATGEKPSSLRTGPPQGTRYATRRQSRAYQRPERPTVTPAPKTAILDDAKASRLEMMRRIAYRLAA